LRAGKALAALVGLLLAGAAGTICAILAPGTPPGPRPIPPGGLHLYFLNVGQGDGALLVTADGVTALVDGGDTNRGPELVKWLRSIGIHQIDWIMPSHPHRDHIGGLNDVLEQLPVRAALVSSQTGTTPAHRRQMELLREKQVPVTVAREGVVLGLGATVTATVLNPPPELLVTNEPVEDNSVLLRVCTEGACALFTGDIGDQGERTLLERYSRSPETLRSQVLKVSHHGAAEPNNPTLLALVKPEVALIGAGAANGYRHPTQRALDRLTASGATVYCTHVDGTILVELTPSSYTVVPMPNVVIGATTGGNLVKHPDLRPGPCKAGGL